VVTIGEKLANMTDDEWVIFREKDKPEKMPMEEWKDLIDMTTSTILLCLANNTLQEFLDLTNSVDIWDKLESWYKSKSLTSRLYLKKRLFDLQMTKEADFNQHLDEFKKTTTKLTSLEYRLKRKIKLCFYCLHLLIIS